MAGQIYKLRYSSTNVHGESDLSDEVSILLAERPAAPAGLTRIDITMVQAGDVRIAWTLPEDEGGDPVLGFRLYLNQVLWEDFSLQSTLNNYTYTGLSVGQTYDFSVTALNDIGESDPASITLIASSPPQKLAVPVWASSTKASITVLAPEP